VLPHLGRFDLLLTDPPYGINRGSHKGSISYWKKHRNYGDWDKMPARPEDLSMCLSITENQIIWGGNYFTNSLPPSMGWIVWDKGQRLTTSDCELAFTSYQKALRRVECNRKHVHLEGAIHPTQKPLKVIRFCLEFAGTVKSMLDPYMGSGTTLVAAKLAGIRAVGIEINEAYCEAAVRRLRQGVLPLSG